MIKVVRALAWVTFLAISATTLLPAGDRPHLAFTSHLAVTFDFDRAAAFLLLGLLLSIGYRRHWPIALGVAVASACGLEAAQLLTPDRDADIADAVVKTAGALAGFGIGSLLSKVSRPIEREIAKRISRYLSGKRRLRASPAPPARR